MSDGMTVEVNSIAFEGAMQRLREGVKDGFIDPNYGTLAVQGRLLAARCQDFTPPQNVAQGRAAVARDLTNIFRPLSQSTFTDKGIRKIIRTDDRPAWDAVAKNFRGSHNLQNTRAIGFSESWHTRNRNRRGRGPRAKYGNIGVVTLGPEAKQARDYTKQKMRLVGWARAGWNMGIFSLGGVAGQMTIQPWVRRHGVARGQFIDGRMNPNPFIQIVNDTGWAQSQKNEGQRIIGNAILARARDMESYYFRMMKLAAARAQTGIAA